MVFVKAGQPKLIRPVGRKWHFRKGYVEFWNGPRSLLYAGCKIGSGDFRLTAKLAVTQNEAVPAFSVGVEEGAIEGFVSKHISYVRGPVNQHRHLLMPRNLIKTGEVFTFEAVRQGPEMTFKIDGRTFHQATYGGKIFGAVGFTAFESGCVLRVSDFSVVGETLSLGDWARTQPWRLSAPEVDISDETERQVVVMRGSKDMDYEHPHTLLMPDNKTMFCVWSVGHGGHCGPMKRSDDGGRSWSELLPVPESWQKTHNCPTIHRVIGSDRNPRLIVFALDRGGQMVQSISEDGGRSWSEMKPTGLGATVPPIRVVPIEGGKQHLILYHRQPNTYQSISADGGLTWGKEQSVAARYDCMPCEPDVIRSPDGRQLTAIMREQWRAYNSMLITSDDEGRTWRSLRESSLEVTGDRHMGRYAPDGRLVIVFRDNSLDTPFKPNEYRTDPGRFVAWVGTYEDLVNSRPGQYRILLLKSVLGCGYPGLEILPDGTFVATTYIGLEPGEQHSIASTRFRLDETDREVKL